MKLLVTGGAGFVGSSLCIWLKKAYPKYNIVAFDNLKRRGSEVNLLDLKNHGVEFVHGDIRNPEDFDSIGAFDVLIDASAEPSILGGIKTNPSYIINNNFNGTINCINACLEFNAKIIYLSTSRVYPIDVINNTQFDEDDTRFTYSENQVENGISELGVSEETSLIGCRSFYGTTKYASEMFIQEYEKFYGIGSIITRFGVIAGPRQMGKTDQGVATLWMAKHFWKQQLQYIGFGGFGKQVRDIIHIDDVCELIDLQIHKPDLFRGKVFNVGGGMKNSASLLEMTSICEEITGNKISIKPHVDNRPADVRMYVSDNSKINNEINWQPKRKTESTFEDIFTWIKDNETKLSQILR